MGAEPSAVAALLERVHEAAAVHLLRALRMKGATRATVLRAVNRLWPEEEAVGEELGRLEDAD